MIKTMRWGKFPNATVKSAGMVQIINLFPSVSAMIELPIPEIQGG